MIYRIINRRVWRTASLEQRSQWLEDLAFKSGGSGEVVIKCQSLRDYWVRIFQRWCLLRCKTLLFTANWLVKWFGYTNID